MFYEHGVSLIHNFSSGRWWLFECFQSWRNEVGFGATSMCIHPEADECPTGGPYALIVSGDHVQPLHCRESIDFSKSRFAIPSFFLPDFAKIS